MGHMCSPEERQRRGLDSTITDKESDKIKLLLPADPGSGRLCSAERVQIASDAAFLAKGPRALTHWKHLTPESKPCENAVCQFLDRHVPDEVRSRGHMVKHILGFHADHRLMGNEDTSTRLRNCRYARTRKVSRTGWM